MSEIILGTASYCEDSEKQGPERHPSEVTREGTTLRHGRQFATFTQGIASAVETPMVNHGAITSVMKQVGTGLGGKKDNFTNHCENGIIYHILIIDLCNGVTGRWLCSLFFPMVRRM